MFCTCVVVFPFVKVECPVFKIILPDMFLIWNNSYYYLSLVK